jgi:hypothetical protein
MNAKTAISVCVPFMFFLTACLQAQAPDTVWTRVYGDDHHEIGECIQQTQDDCFVIVGSNHSNSFGSYDVYLMKIDQNGDTLWTQHYGSSDTEMGTSIVETADGDFFIVGNYDEYMPYSPRDIYLIKTDANGNEDWSTLFGGPEDDFANQIKKLPSGDYIIVGGTESYGSGDYDVWLLYLNSFGDTVWTKTIGGANREWGFAIDYTSDGGFIIAGSKNYFDSNAEDVYLAKTDSAGNMIWTKSYEYLSCDRAYDVKATPDGGCIAAGFALSPAPPMRDILVLKTDTNGDTIWTRRYGGDSDDDAHSVLITNAGNYVIAGFRQFDEPQQIDLYIMCLDVNGDTIWTKSLNRGPWTEANCIMQTENGGYIVTGETKNYYDHDWELDLYLAKLTPDVTNIDNDFDEVLPKSILLNQNYPNPFNEVTSISYNLPYQADVTLDIYDILGRKIARLIDTKQPAGYHLVIWDASHKSNGIYFYKIQAGNYMETKKMLLLK